LLIKYRPEKTGKMEEVAVKKEPADGFPTGG